MARRSVWGTFVERAIVWLIPALLLLPIYLVLLAISAVAADGSLLHATEGVRGGINAALGPLLVLAGIAALVATAMLAEALDESSIGVAVFGLVTIGLGVVLWQQVLADLRKAKDVDANG